MDYVVRYGKQIEVETIQSPPRPRRKTFEPRFVQVPRYLDQRSGTIQECKHLSLGAADPVRGIQEQAEERGDYFIHCDGGNAALYQSAGS